MASLQIKFKPDYEDYLAIGKATTYNKNTIILLALMGVFAIGSLLSILMGWVAYEPDNLGLYLVPHGVYVFFLLYTPFHLRRTARQSASDAHEIAWQVTQRGISVNTGTDSDRHAWRSFHFAQELPEHYILYFKTNRVKTIFIPKRAFTSSVQESNFRELINKYLGRIR